MPSSDRFFTLENAAGLRISVLNYGAIWDGCSVPMADGTRREVLLGCPDADGYRRQQSGLGATIGRYANRIANARFQLDDHDYTLTANEGRNHLHGGDGFDHRDWALVSHSPRELVLSLVSEEGDQGYPGRMEATATYALGDDLSLSLTYEATVSAPCPVNLTSHAYFNLNGDGLSCLDHSLRIAGDTFLPTNETQIPTGERKPVMGTGFDFRTPHTIGERLRLDPEQQGPRGYDHAYWLDGACASGQLPAAELRSGDGRLQMALFTQLPTLQLYSGNWLEGTLSRDGGRYASHAGVALEPQFAPDSPNHPEWPDSVIRPGQRYRQQLRYVFSAG